MIHVKYIALMLFLNCHIFESQQEEWKSKRLRDVKVEMWKRRLASKWKNLAFRVKLYILSECHNFQDLQLFLLYKLRPGNGDQNLQLG